MSPWPLICLIACTVIALVPVLRSPLVPLLDYPGHLASLYALSHLGQFNGVYTSVWRPYPNLALDAVVLPLAHLMTVPAAGHLAVIATLVLLISGVAALQRALFRRVGAMSLLAPLLLYNEAFILGFLGYLLALGACLLVIAAWIASRSWRPLPRVLLFAPLGVVLYLGHLFVFGIFALVIGVMCLEEIWRTRRVMPLITVAATCLPALCLFLAGQTARQAGVTQYGPWSIHEAALMAPTRTYGGLIDRVALGFIVAVFVVGLATRLLTVAAALRWPLVTLLLFAIAMPDTLFDGYSVALRLPIALAFLAVGASSVQNAPTRIVLAGSLVAAVILVVQVFAIGTYWQLLQKQQQELIDALNLALQRHARVITVMDPISSHHYRSAGGQPVSLTPYPHMADLAMISRDVYLPSVFSLANKQPLLGVGPFARFSQRDQPALDPGDLQQTIGVGDEDCKVPGPLKPYCGWERYFDYVLLLNFGWPHIFLPDHLSPVTEGSFFVLYRVNGAGDPAKQPSAG
jgi:hypothetical protein